jgi:hypothetical protein
LITALSRAVVGITALSRAVVGITALSRAVVGITALSRAVVGLDPGIDHATILVKFNYLTELNTYKISKLQTAYLT